VARPERRVERAEDAFEAAEADQLAQVTRHVDGDVRAAQAQARELLDLPQVRHLLGQTVRLPKTHRSQPTAAVARMAA
jgi:hypothetical protein